MGTTQPFRTSTDWNQAIDMLDTLFPLTSGSHATVRCYLMHLEHLVVIHENGSATGLQNSNQLIEVGGNPESPSSIVLENNGLQVEIEPATHKAAFQNCGIAHRMQLVTHIQTA